MMANAEPTKHEKPDCDELEAGDRSLEAEGRPNIPQIDRAIEKRLKRKLDLILIPTLAFGYVFNSLDKSNLANARTAGLSTDLNLTGNLYNLVLTWYYLPFVILGPFLVLASKHYSAKYVIPIMLLGFGIPSACTSVVRNYGGLVAIRCLIGLFEGGYLGTNIYYLGSWYTRREIAARVGFFFSASVFASAFGGLLAYGIFHLPSTPSTPDWTYLFILEGCATVFMSFVIFFVIPKSIRTAYFLTEEEKDCAEARLLSDAINAIQPEFRWSEALNEFKTWHVYYRAIISLCFGVLLASNANFLAIIVQRLGFDTVKTNLYTVAPALSAAVILIMVCYSSDRFQARGVHMTGILSLSVVGYIILMTVDPSNVPLTYFAIFLCTIGAYPMSVIFSAWILDNITNQNARAFTLGVLIALGNASGLISSNIFFTNEAPRYMSALIGNLVCAILCMSLCIAYVLWMKYENKRRDRVFGVASNVTADVGDSRDPNFRFRA